MEQIVICDRVHGDIVINNPLIMKLINAREFQRLQDIKQLSTAFFKFRGANHTRFEHSIGAYHVMTNMTDHFESTCKQWKSSDSELAQVAALLHDIGHGPYSHTFEALFDTNHEEVTCQILLSEETQIHKILEEHKQGFSKKVADVISHKHKNKAITDLISSQLDADRIDYLMRDRANTGASYISFNKDAIIRNMVIVNGRVVFNKDALSDIENFVLGRHQMYKNVYFHRTNRSAVVLLQSMLKRAKDLYPDAKDFFRITASRLVPFFENNYDLTDYLKLDDSMMNAIFSLWESSGDPILSDLAAKYKSRILPKSIAFQDSEEDLVILKDILSKNGYVVDYYTEVNNSWDLPYDVYHDDVLNPRTEIKLLSEDGELTELSVASKQVQSITSIPYIDKRFFFPREVKEQGLKFEAKKFEKLTRHDKFHPEELDLKK